VWGPCIGEVVPEANQCDGIDRACTGDPAQGCDCVLDETRTCYTGPDVTRNVGPCHAGLRTCEINDGVVAWSAQCAGEVVPEDETCGNEIDEDCDGELDNGCGEISCPASVTTPAGHAVDLAVTGTNVTNYRWEIIAAPEGSGSSATWPSNPLTSANEQLLPYIVGTYTVRVTADNPVGEPRSCTVDVTALPHGLRVELAWDGVGDVDLHLHDNSPTAWFTTPGDCYYSNCKPTTLTPLPWGVTLDTDNTMTSGPENIAVDIPVIGTTYTIGVHNFSRSADRIATVNVFCGNANAQATEPDQTFVSRALTGTASGNCTENDFWRVAQVTFTSESECTITPIDTYSPSSQACTAL